MAPYSLAVGRIEIRIWLEAEAVARAVRSIDHALVFIEKSIGQQAEHFIGAVAVFLFLFVAMGLQLGVSRQVVQAVDLCLLRVGVPAAQEPVAVAAAGGADGAPADKSPTFPGPGEASESASSESES